MHAGNAGRFAIFGAGASARETAWLAEQCLGERVELSFLIDLPDGAERASNGTAIVQLAEFAKRHPGTPSVVAIGNPSLRELCAKKCAVAGLSFATLIHPRIELSRWVEFGDGSIVCAGSTLTTNIVVGRHVHINVGCTVSHDARLGDFATLSPGVHVSGWVTIGSRAFIGTGAVIKNGSSAHPLVIGNDAVIGAGACVISNVEPYTKMAGVPARPI